MWVVLILGLIAAGIYTDNSGFYIAAGAVGTLVAVITVVALLGVKSIKKKIDKDFSDFDKNFKL